jgi:hypothetical protein
MKTIYFLLLIISIQANGQKKTGNDVFNMEFLRNSDNTQGEQNDYFTFLVDRSIQHKKNLLEYGFLNAKGKMFIKAKYTYASDFFNGKSNILLDSIPGILFKDGREKFFRNFNSTFWYKGDLGLAIKNKKHGFINYNGHVIIPLIYEDAFPFYDGYASVKLNNKWNYVDEQGKTVFPDSLIFSYRPIINDNAVFMNQSKEVETKKRMFSDDRKGSQAFVEFLHDLTPTQLKEGLINIQGTVIIEPIYDEISGYFINGYMRVRNKGKEGIIDEKGKVIIPIDYDNVLDYNNNMFTAKKDNK